jgi:hypothetical protein
MFVPRRWPLLSAPVITAVIIGAGIFAPSPVFAECGSYIVYTDPSHRSVDEKPMMEHKAPVPCHGPGCSQVPPPAPMPPAPPTLRILVDDPLIGSSDKSLVLPSSDRIVFDSTDGEVVRQPTDIFHPPR